MQRAIRIFNPYFITATTIVLLALMCNHSYANSNARLIGTYKCKASSTASKHNYYSRLTIKQFADTDNIFKLSWKFKDGHQSSATGFVKKLGKQRALVAAFSGDRQAPQISAHDTSGVVSYAVRQHNRKAELTGFWYYQGASYVGNEFCRKVR